MAQEKFLVLGACGQLGTELTTALRKNYGDRAVIATDIQPSTPALSAAGPYAQLDAMDGVRLQQLIQQEKITQVYMLVAMLSATGERFPQKAWDLNMQSLIALLEIARVEGIKKIFWPSSIAVFGPCAPKLRCPQGAALDPQTIYGISKMAGEQWCSWYYKKYGLDVRSVRYPGLISHSAAPGGGTTDYAVDIFRHAIRDNVYTCYLSAQTALPMMYMPDAIRATLELMDAPGEDIRIRTSYNLSGISFTPQQLDVAIKQQLPGFKMNYAPDYRQSIADSWPYSIDDIYAQNDWGWKPGYDLGGMVNEMLEQLMTKVL